MHGFYNRNIVCCIWRNRTYLILLRVRVLSCCSFVWLFCDPMERKLSGSSVHGILQARTLECVAMPSSRGSSWPRDQTHISYVSCTGKRLPYHHCHLGSPSSLISQSHLIHFCLPCNLLCTTFWRKEKKLYSFKSTKKNPHDLHYSPSVFFLFV